MKEDIKNTIAHTLEFTGKMTPSLIKVENLNIFLKWADGIEKSIKLSNLRRNCPCAECAAEREKESKTYIPIYSQDQLSIVKITPVGNYAIGITWKDNHNTGIYTFEQLKQFQV